MVHQSTADSHLYFKDFAGMKFTNIPCVHQKYMYFCTVNYRVVIEASNRSKIMLLKKNPKQNVLYKYSIWPEIEEILLLELTPSLLVQMPD